MTNKRRVVTGMQTSDDEEVVKSNKEGEGRIRKGKKEDKAPESPKTRATNQAKKEVEQNPFRKLIDISDLIDFEQNPVEVEKEC